MRTIKLWPIVIIATIIILLSYTNPTIIIATFIGLMISMSIIKRHNNKARRMSHS